jgi:hypothetical protein
MTTGKEPGPLVRADAAEHLDPVEPRELQIEHHHLGQGARIAPAVGARSEQVIERLDAVPHHNDGLVDPPAPQGPHGKGFVVRVVFHQQEGRPRPDHGPVIRG